jgi:hypothetical protein
VTAGLQNPLAKIKLAGAQQLVVAPGNKRLCHLAHVVFDCLHHKSNHAFGFNRFLKLVFSAVSQAFHGFRSFG